MRDRILPDVAGPGGVAAERRGTEYALPDASVKLNRPDSPKDCGGAIEVSVKEPGDHRTGDSGVVQRHGESRRCE